MQRLAHAPHHSRPRQLIEAIHNQITVLSANLAIQRRSIRAAYKARACSLRLPHMPVFFGTDDSAPPAKSGNVLENAEEGTLPVVMDTEHRAGALMSRLSPSMVRLLRALWEGGEEGLSGAVKRSASLEEDLEAYLSEGGGSLALALDRYHIGYLLFMADIYSQV